MPKLTPLNHELPSHFADRLGSYYASQVTGEHKKIYGQFFTPLTIANFMGNLVDTKKKELKILDPGCGTAILSCCLIEQLIKQNQKIKKLELITYETDIDLLPYTQNSLDYLAKWISQFDVEFQYTLNTKDFILDNKECFEKTRSLFDKNLNEIYDVVISNPPYFKIPKEDKRAIVAQSIVYGQPNIYSIFLATATKLLKLDGELIFITPRSFASGHYFKVFREMFFSEIEIEKIHLFDSRTDTFTRDNVLQETLIIKGNKKRNYNKKSNVSITSSHGIKDIAHPRESIYRLNELIDFDSKEKIIHLPINEYENKVIKLFKSWHGNLHQYNIQISTGPVVSFRAKEFLHEGNSTKLELIPLFQLHNTSKMEIDWPIIKANKPQYMELCEQTKSLLILNKNYIFLRRFSSKDDKSRLIATPYFADITQAKYIGIENHLNYIYRPHGDLLNNEIIGLSALLNSSLFDTYFRTFNGNINVSATELRGMPLPDIDSIKKIGAILISEKQISQEKIDKIVNHMFNFEDNLVYA